MRQTLAQPSTANNRRAMASVRNESYRPKSRLSAKIQRKMGQFINTPFLLCHALRWPYRKASKKIKGVNEMPFTVFYAWQADRSNKLNRWFIDRALINAIKTLSKEMAKGEEIRLEDAPPVDEGETSESDPDPQAGDEEILLQWGAQGQHGAHLIGETIFDRIESCGVFIGDVSFVATAKTYDGREKHLPNSNVLIELGAAAKTGAKWNRMILVMNTAFGSVEDLPFDLRHRSCKVSYDLSDINDPEKVKKRSQLTRDFIEQLRPMYRDWQTRLAERTKRHAQSAAASVAAQRNYVSVRGAIGHSLVGRIWAGKFYDIKGKRIILTLGVVPWADQNPPLTFSEEALSFNRPDSHFIPMSGQSFAQPKNEMRGLAVVVRREDKKVSLAATEITERGMIYAARHMCFSEELHAKTELPERIEVPAKYTEALFLWPSFHYVQLLRSLRVPGPYIIHFGIMKAKGMAWIPDDHYQLYKGRVTEIDDDEISPDPVVIPDNFDDADKMAFAGYFRNSLNQMWRGLGFAHALFYDQAGKYTGLLEVPD